MTLVVIIISCTQEDTRNSGIALNLNVALSSNETRAPIEDFINGSQIGLFVIKENGDNYNDCDCSFNQTLTKNIQKWDLGQEIVLSNEVANIYSYYPFKEELSEKKIEVEVASQTDYLYGLKTTANSSSATTTIIMKHALSLNSFIIKKKDYSGNGLLTKIEISGVDISGTMDILTGAISSDIQKGKITVTCNVTLDNNQENKLSFITMPMLIGNTNNVVATFTIDDTEYKYQIDTEEWEQGKENVYTLSIAPGTKQLVEIGSVTLDSWQPGGNYEGNLEKDKFQVDTDIQ